MDFSFETDATRDALCDLERLMLIDFDLLIEREALRDSDGKILPDWEIDWLADCERLRVRLMSSLADCVTLWRRLTEAETLCHLDIDMLSLFDLLMD